MVPDPEEMFSKLEVDEWMTGVRERRMGLTWLLWEGLRGWAASRGCHMPDVPPRTLHSLPSSFSASKVQLSCSRQHVVTPRPKVSGWDALSATLFLGWQEV